MFLISYDLSTLDLIYKRKVSCIHTDHEIVNSIEWNWPQACSSQSFPHLRSSCYGTRHFDPTAIAAKIIVLRVVIMRMTVATPRAMSVLSVLQILGTLSHARSRWKKAPK